MHILLVALLFVPVFPFNSDDSVAQNNVIKTPDPVAYWAFDEGSGDTILDATHSHPGKVQGAQWSAECVQGRCLYFDGKDDKATVPHKEQFDVSNKKREEFTIVALPDTQFYPLSYPSIFQKQTQWIANNKDKLNIKFVIHLGDIVNHPASIGQWKAASEFMRTLDGVVPYLVVPGNHDFGALNTNKRDYLNYNKFFPYSWFEKYPWYGGHFPPDGNQNNFGFFEQDGQRFIVLGLTFHPDFKDLKWANAVLSQHKDKLAIVFTHKYMNYRYNARTLVGKFIFEELISKHPNIVLVLSGHVLGTGAERRVDYIKGQPVNQVLHNSQMLLNGGQGYLRYYTFKINQNTIDAKTYSPYLDKFLTDPAQQFSMDYRKKGLTVSAWIKTGNLKDQIIVSRQGDTDGSFYLATLKVVNEEGRVAFGITNSASKVAVGTVSFPYANNEWHHLAGVYDGEQMHIYVDGELIYSLPPNKGSTAQFLLPEGLIKKTSLPIEIGSYGGPGWKFKGSIDEVKLFNKALTANQISQEYLRHIKN